MYAQLDIWRSSAGYVPPTPAQQQQQPQHKPVGKEDSLDISYVLNMRESRDEEDAAAAAAASVPTSSASVASPFSGAPMAPSPSMAASALSPPPPYPSTSSSSLYDNPVPGTSAMGEMQQQQQYFKAEPEDNFSDEGAYYGFLSCILNLIIF